MISKVSVCVAMRAKTDRPRYVGTRRMPCGQSPYANAPCAAAPVRRRGADPSASCVSRRAGDVRAVGRTIDRRLRTPRPVPRGAVCQLPGRTPAGLSSVPTFRTCARDAHGSPLWATAVCARVRRPPSGQRARATPGTCRTPKARSQALRDFALPSGGRPTRFSPAKSRRQKPPPRFLGSPAAQRRGPAATRTPRAGRDPLVLGKRGPFGRVCHGFVESRAFHGCNASWADRTRSCRLASEAADARGAGAGAPRARRGRSQHGQAQFKLALPRAGSRVSCGTGCGTRPRPPRRPQPPQSCVWSLPRRVRRI